MTAPAATSPVTTSAGITVLSVEQYRAVQDRISQQTAAPTVALLRALAGRSANDSLWANILTLLLPIVQKRRDNSRQAASLFFAGQAPSGTAPPIPTASYDVHALNDALTRTSRSLLASDVQAERTRAVIDGTAAVVRHVEMAGRDFIRQASVADQAVDGWARVARGASTCSFCLLLISRGPVYKTAAGAGLLNDGTMDRWHDHCDCLAVPVFDRENWPGQDQYHEAERLYIEATGHVSGSKAKMKAFRDAVEGMKLDASLTTSS